MAKLGIRVQCNDAESITILWANLVYGTTARGDSEIFTF